MFVLKKSSKKIVKKLVKIDTTSIYIFVTFPDKAENNCSNAKELKRVALAYITYIYSSDEFHHIIVAPDGHTLSIFYNRQRLNQLFFSCIRPHNL